ncbi:hypothetical protein PG997_010209 [Apiospora hydei]|uniref:Uncharacterized protein n=1 Tax=Apiospora hydei TaxID=1337664 RepID=A0ABR1VYY0_9PEZI
MAIDRVPYVLEDAVFVTGGGPICVTVIYVHDGRRINTRQRDSDPIPWHDDRRSGMPHGDGGS